MADERDRWLDGAAADRLLRGEPVEPVGPAAAPRARREAARLRAALDALAEPPRATAAGELPGEADALAAFRAARGAAAAAGEPLVNLGHASHIGNVRHTGVRGAVPRRGRTVRFGLAAALASVAVGGLAAAAGAGLLDRSQHDSAEPGPAMSVSADDNATPAEGGTNPPRDPLLRPTPLRDGTGTTATAGAGGTTTPGAGASAGAGTPSGTAKDNLGGHEGKDGNKDAFANGGSSKEGDRDRENRLRALDMCKDYKAGHIDDDRRDRLSRLARGIAGIPRFCESLQDGPTTGGLRGGAPGSAGSADGDSVLQAPTLVPALPGDPSSQPTGR